MSIQARETQPFHQITTIKLLAESLHTATRNSTALTNQAQNELSLLLPVLSAIETYASSLGSDCTHVPVLKKRLQSCHEVLLDLQKLHLQPDALGAQSLISDIRARFSSVVFGLSELNTNMMISSQKHIRRALGSLVEARGDANFSKTLSQGLTEGKDKEEHVDEDQAWELLRGELSHVGISFEMATLNRDLIVSTMRKIVETQGPLPGTKVSTPVENASEASSPVSVSGSDHRSSNDHLDEFAELPFLPLPPVGISYSDRPRSYPDPDRYFSDKQPLPLDEYPIPVAMELGMEKEIQMQEPLDPSQQSQLQTNPPIPKLETKLTNPNSNTQDQTLQIQQTKKARRLSRLRWTLTGTREPFIASIQEGNVSKMQSHLQKGADPNTQNSTGQSALMVSVSYAHEPTTRALLEYGADPNLQDLNGQTALSTACIRGLDRLATMLLLSGARVGAGGKPALVWAAEYGRESTVRILLEAGAGVDGMGAGETALGVAARKGNLEVVRVLLEGGARVERGRFGSSPLFEAVRGGWVEVVRVLMQFGANPYFVARGVSVIDVARRMGGREVLGVLEEFGVNVDAFCVQYF